jgi:hypothetical protein
MRDKYIKRHKIEAQFYEHNYIHARYWMVVDVTSTPMVEFEWLLPWRCTPPGY